MCLVVRLHAENHIGKQFHCCATIVECTYSNLNDWAYYITPVIQDGLGYKPEQYVELYYTLLYYIEHCSHLQHNDIPIYKHIFTCKRSNKNMR